jgi:hypothetical protein
MVGGGVYTVNLPTNKGRLPLTDLSDRPLPMLLAEPAGKSSEILYLHFKYFLSSALEEICKWGGGQVKNKVDDTTT